MKGKVRKKKEVFILSVFIFAGIINRDYDPLSALSLSALIILWANPYQLFDAGFQLSFLSVLSILVFYRKILLFFPKGIQQIKVTRALSECFSVSLSAWIGTLGIVAYYFNIITPVSVLANLIIIPLLFLVILSALMLVFTGICVPVAAPIIALNCEFFISLIYNAVNTLTNIILMIIGRNND